VAFVAADGTQIQTAHVLSSIRIVQFSALAVQNDKACSGKPLLLCRYGGTFVSILTDQLQAWLSMTFIIILTIYVAVVFRYASHSS
jgi:hypothetical protein